MFPQCYMIVSANYDPPACVALLRIVVRLGINTVDHIMDLPRPTRPRHIKAPQIPGPEPHRLSIQQPGIHP